MELSPFIKPINFALFPFAVIVFPIILLKSPFVKTPETEAKANKIKGLTKTQKVGATALISKNIVSNLKSPQKQVGKKTQKGVSLTKQKTFQIGGLIGGGVSKAKTKVKSATSQATKQKSKSLQKTKTKVAQKSLQKQRGRLAQRTRLKLLQKQVTKQPIRARGITYLRIPKRIALIKPTKKGKKIIKKKTKRTKPQPVFNVFGKSGKKFVKLNTKPLTRDDALSRGAFAIDRTTSKTFKITPAGKTKSIGKLSKNEKGYFNRAGYKLRAVKIRKGRKFKLQNKYIEKRKFGIDTRGEKTGLTIARLLKQERSKKTPTRKTTIKRTAKRKVTPTQRKVLLQRLKKARAVRMQENLKDMEKIQEQRMALARENKRLASNLKSGGAGKVIKKFGVGLGRGVTKTGRGVFRGLQRYANFLEEQERKQKLLNRKLKTTKKKTRKGK